MRPYLKKPYLMKPCLILFIGALTACGGIGKTKPAPAVFDFGISELNTAKSSEIAILNITANSALTSNRIRYRLNYQNPAQVFFYTESAWTAPPAVLMLQKISAIKTTNTQQLCGLNMNIEAFDHVFYDAKNSQGVVIVKAQLFDKKSRQALQSELLEAKVAANSADAKGGVAALNSASDAVISAVLDWGVKAAKQNATCSIN